jgi:hypothetical protein
MMMHRMAVTLAAGLLMLAACGDSRNGPTPFPSGPPDVAFTLANGVTGEKVAGAHVIADGREFSSGGSGEVLIPSAPTPFPSVEVRANGYLTRRTRARNAGVLTLWPAATTEDADAIEAMVFGGLSARYTPRRSEPFFVTTAFEGVDDAAAARDTWQREINSVNLQTGSGFAIHEAFTYEQEITVRFDQTAASCPSAWGFCALPGPYRGALVRRDLAADPVVIRRVLAYAVLSANPQPGLLNTAHPADDLSRLEAGTIRMLFLRDGMPIGAPDFDLR